MEAPSIDPLVSVILPVWNAEATVDTAIRSVFDGNDIEIECLVVDDGSTDTTLARVEELARSDARIRVLRNEGNQGVSVARNRALDAARGTWLAFVDADDRLMPGAISLMVRVAEERDALVVIGQRISNDGEHSWFPRRYANPDVQTPGRKALITSPGLLYYAAPVGRIIHRSCAEGLRFEGRMLGDQPWVLQAELRAGDSMEVIGDVVYEWRRPRSDAYFATITAERMRSVALSLQAIEMAARAYDVVSAAWAPLLDGDRRVHMDALYFDRLAGDVAVQLRSAIERRDPDLALLVEGLADFVQARPPAVVGASRVVNRKILEPLVEAWDELDPRARLAFWRLVRVLNPRRTPAYAGLRHGLSATWGMRLAQAIDLPPSRALAMRQMRRWVKRR